MEERGIKCSNVQTFKNRLIDVFMNMHPRPLKGSTGVALRNLSFLIKKQNFLKATAVLPLRGRGCISIMTNKLNFLQKFIISHLKNSLFNLFPFFPFLSFLLFFSSCSLPAKAQKEPANTNAYALVNEIPIRANYSTTDKLQQLYISTTDNTIIKYSPEGKELFRYNNNTLGNVNFIDATDPFNVLVYYPDFETLITLDRTLNKTGEFNLFDFDIVDVQVVAMSNGNNIWLYDNVTFKLKKISPNGKVAVESNDLSLLLDQSLAPNFMLERNNQIYINDSKWGIYVFDIFGQYVKHIDIKNLSEFQILKQQLIYIQGQSIHSFHLETLLDRTIVLPQKVEENDRIQVQKDKLFWIGEDYIRIYQFGLD